MACGTFRGRIFDGLGIGMGLGAMLVVLGATFGGSSDREYETRGTFHKITYPVIQFTSDNDCVQEAASYATAVVNLEAAQEAADDAYAAWYNCEHNQDPGIPDPPGDPEPEAMQATLASAPHSVLER